MSAVKNDIVVTRLLDAPRALVFEAWTDPRHVVHWWTPKGFAAPEIQKMDVRPGGEWRVHMPFNDGTVYVAHGIYREVVKDERISWDDFCDEKGKLFHKAFVTVTFEDMATGKTRVTLRARLEAVADRDPRWTMETMEQGWVEGWKDNLAVLAGYLPKVAAEADLEIRFTRVYDAPRSLVFKVWTELEHVTQWWGPRGFTTTTKSMEVKPGGQWRYTMHGPDGVDYPNLTTFLEVVKPERLVYDHGDEENPRMFRVTVTFTNAGAGTRLDMRMVFASAAERDFIVVKHGAVGGGNQTLDRLGEHLSKMDQRDNA